MNGARYGSHQKLLVGEQIPANAFYLHRVLSEVLVNVRLLHAALSNASKAKLCRQLDPFMIMIPLVLPLGNYA